MPILETISQRRPSLTTIFIVLFVVYISHSMYSLHTLFVPPDCPRKTGKCITAYLDKPKELQLWVYTSRKKEIRHLSEVSDLDMLWKPDNFSAFDELTETLSVKIPSQTRKNGTLYVHVFVTPCSVDDVPVDRSIWQVIQSGLLTTYAVPQATTFNLMGDEKTNGKENDRNIPVSHWKSKLTINIMTDPVSFDRYSIPGEVHKYMFIANGGKKYLPILYLNDIEARIEDRVPLNESCKEMSLTIDYRPISIGKLRFWSTLGESFNYMKNLGLQDKDVDEVKGIFTGTSLQYLLLTFFIAAFHLLFDILAFKNDISFWRGRDDMQGLSTRTVLWRCFSTIVIFFYLLDEDTSILVLGPTGISAIIEIWKVFKAFKIRVSWSGGIEFGTRTAKENETTQFDTQAMKYLSYILYPLCICVAVYSLLYTPHKSWYSWCIHSLVNGIYAFGFIFMMPQLFINYKLKSVAHLPWRAFMYKAFNTFIDDVFAFIIKMPTLHRIACLRDDVVFVIYLIQRWMYPVDKTRVNEYGQVFDDDKKKTN